MKKLLSALLVVMMLLTMVPAGALAVSAANSGTTGDCTWTLVDGHLTVSGNGAMGDYDCLSDYYAPWWGEITSVTIGDSVTTIGNYAFFGCSGLTSVTIPDSVTTIGENSFGGCDSLTSVTIGDSVTTIGDEAFSWCTSLTSVTIPDSVTTMGSVFSYCDSLKEIVVADTNPNYCSVEGVLFDKEMTVLIQCPGGITGAYTIPDSVTTIEGWAFFYCTSLTSVTIPESVTTIGNYAFCGCGSLESVTIGYSVTTIGEYAFYYCTALTDVYYGGSEMDRENIVIGSQNDSLVNATWHYNHNSSSLIPSDAAEYNGHYYKVFQEGKSWAAAKHQCELLGGYLATITSVDEQEFVVTLVEENRDYWLGGYKNNNEWAWVTGEAWAYTNWDEGEPNNYLGRGENCLQLIPNKKWNDQLNEGDPSGVSSADIFFICEWSTPYVNATPFSLYFVDCLSGHWNDIYTDLPCETIIANGGVANITWNAVLESIKSLGNFKLGVDEKKYFESILLDLITGNVSSVDYKKELAGNTKDLLGKLSSYMISKGVNVSKENLENADLDNMWGCLQSYTLASDLELTKTGFDELTKGCTNAAECLDKISTYLIAAQEGQHLQKAIAEMKANSDYEPLTECLTEIATVLNASTNDLYTIVASKEVGEDTVQTVGDFLLGVINTVLPFETIKDLASVVEYGCELILPVTTRSEQFFRIYTLYYIEGVAKESLKTSYQRCCANKTAENGEVVLSCYEMFVRVYEHEIAECLALSKLIYEEGILNGIKNAFSDDHWDEWQAAEDWINSFNVGLDKLKQMKEDAYIEWGVNAGLLKAVRHIGVWDGKITGYSVEYVNVGEQVSVPNYSALFSKNSLAPFLDKLGTFEGWFYDEACTKPCMATHITVNKHIVLYCKFSTNTTSSHNNVKATTSAGAVSPSATFKAEEVRLSDVVEVLPDSLKEKNVLAYDMYFEEGEQRVQPSEDITVSIPVPTSMNGNNCRVLHITNDGSTEDMNAVFVNGHMFFLTNHFSYYALVEEPNTIIPGDANGDGKVNNRDLGLLQQYINDWDVVIDLNSADLNDDGRVNNRDLGLLQQLLNK